MKAAIEAKSPKTLKEADDYKESGKAGEVKGEVKGLVTAGQGGPGQGHRDRHRGPAGPVQGGRQAGHADGPGAAGPAAAIPAAGAAPKPAPAEQLNLAAGKHAGQPGAGGRRGHRASSWRSRTSREFQQALADKQAAAAHADTAPGQFRQQEQDVIEQGKADAAAETAAGVTGMQGAKGAALAKLVADKGKTKSKDEAKRAEVTAKIQGIFAATEADVKKILDGIDPKVEAAFEQGEAAARAAFESYVAAKMSAYKKDRYGGWLGGAALGQGQVARDAREGQRVLRGRPRALPQADGRRDLAGRRHRRQRPRRRRRSGSRPARPRSPRTSRACPPTCRRSAPRRRRRSTRSSSSSRATSTPSRSRSSTRLATKYVEARKGLDERIEALQAENKGLVDKAIGAIKAVINTIRELAAMLKNVLARVAGRRRRDHQEPGRASSAT